MELWILKALYSLFGSSRVLYTDRDEERDFLDHERREGWGGRIHSKINVDLVQETSKAQVWQARSQRRGFIHTDDIVMSWWDKDRCWDVRSISAVGRKVLPGRKAQVVPGKATANDVTLWLAHLERTDKFLRDLTSRRYWWTKKLTELPAKKLKMTVRGIQIYSQVLNPGPHSRDLSH